MKKSITLFIYVGLVGTALIMPAKAFSQRKAKAAPETSGIKLEYNFPENKPISYSNVTNMLQTMDYNGQTMNANILVVLSCTVTGRGKESDMQKIEVKIDTMKQDVQTPQGSTGGLINDAMGKSFNMTLSGSGKEIDLTEAEKIVINTESIQTNAGQSFIDYFPDVPKNTIKVGDTWVTNDTITTKSTSMSLTMIVRAENKFEGLEKIDGVECARISSTISGTRDQASQTMGMDVSTSGTFTGTSQLWFAVKEGYLIKTSSVSKLTGTIEIGGAQNLSMPMVADINTMTKLK